MYFNSKVTQFQASFITLSSPVESYRLPFTFFLLFLSNNTPRAQYLSVPVKAHNPVMQRNTCSLTRDQRLLPMAEDLSPPTEESPSQYQRQHQQHHLPPDETDPPLKHMGKVICSSHKPGTSSAKRSVCACITIFLLLVGITLLVLWLVYRPNKPRFKVVGAAIYGLNTTTPSLMSTTMQFTILIRNPNRRVSLYYDKFSTFISYRNQAITQQVMLPPLYLAKHSTVSLSPVIGGTPVPVSPEVSNGLVVDEAYGVVNLKLVFLGRLRWKAGPIKTAHYGLYVRCDLVMGLKKGFVGQVPLLGAPDCDVDV